ncbi:MAG: hypothetical protein NVS9B12_01400 [Vulcanimicrobiaceae bacterium]
MSTPTLERFKAAARANVCVHPVVVHNAYTAWFSEGKMSLGELRHFTVQFSVFSHLFLEAQLRKCINSRTIESYHAGKEILLNELGVSFGPAGSVDGSRFRFTAAHFEWLLTFASHLGLEFGALGKRALGTHTTLRFCEVLLEQYGSDDASTAAGASYAIEHWAAAGFWKELISGLRRFKERSCPDLPLGFWTWHDQIEDLHAEHTDDELADTFALEDFDEKAFLNAASAVLDAVAQFWDGLASDRLMTKVA